IFISWLRFSRRHRHSRRLPIIYFLLLYLDGFVMVIPSTLCMVTCITISPARWLFFSLIFPVAATLNNATTYLLGTLVPYDTLVSVIHFFSLELFWQQASEAIHKY